jgi:hypothetical protein
MADKEKRENHIYRRGGQPKSDKPSKGPAEAPAPNKSWEPGRKGQGVRASARVTAAAVRAPVRRDQRTTREED